MLKNINIPFIKYRYFFIAISVALFVGSIVVIFAKGFNYGIDFEGGAKIAYQFKNPVTEGEVRKALEGTPYASASVVRFGEKKEKRMSIKVSLPEEHAKIGEGITAALEAKFGKGEVMAEAEETVGPKVGQEMRKKALLTIIFSWAMMLIYIGYRFDFLFGPGALLALVHDTVITLGIFALMGKEVNLTILAAILTIIGFSINDTIVVFDRIRENLAKIRERELRTVVNKSINETLGRTIITSVTTALSILPILFITRGTIQNFALALMIGIFIGTYSTIFIASPIALWVDKRFYQKKSRR